MNHDMRLRVNIESNLYIFAYYDRFAGIFLDDDLKNKSISAIGNLSFLSKLKNDFIKSYSGYTVSAGLTATDIVNRAFFERHITGVGWVPENFISDLERLKNV